MSLPGSFAVTEQAHPKFGHSPQNWKLLKPILLLHPWDRKGHLHAGRSLCYKLNISPLLARMNATPTQSLCFG